MQRVLNNLASSSNTRNIQHQKSGLTDNTNIAPRITVNAVSEASSRQHLLPPQPDLRNAFASLKVRRDITNSGTTSVNITRGREEEREVERSQGARPKEPWHRLRLLTTARNIEDRELLDDEYVQSDGGFIRVNRQLNPHATPRQRKKIAPPRESSSSSGDYSPSPRSLSHLQVDFRDLSPSSEEELRRRHSTNQTRRSLGEETRRSQQRSRREDRRDSPIMYRDNSLTLSRH